MPVGVRINIDLNGLDREMREMVRGLDNFRTPLKQSSIYMEGAIGRRFRKAPWKPLSPATIAIHPHRAGGKPLNDTGKLRMSVTSRAVKRIRARKLEYGTNLIYAPLHNFGGRGGWGKMIPKREFLYFDKQDERAIQRIFEDYIKELSPNG
jgi:phage gpG-like protein